MNKKLKWGSPQYKAIHKLIQTERGSASLNKCVDCGNDAENWSHIFDTDAENIFNYESRCEKCHRKYDFKHYGNHLAKLTDSQVREIRAKYKGGATRKQLADEYGIAPSTAANVALGIKYKSVV